MAVARALRTGSIAASAYRRWVCFNYCTIAYALAPLLSVLDRIDIARCILHSFVSLSLTAFLHRTGIVGHATIPGAYTAERLLHVLSIMAVCVSLTFETSIITFIYD